MDRLMGQIDRRQKCIKKEMKQQRVGKQGYAGCRQATGKALLVDNRLDGGVGDGRLLLRLTRRCCHLSHITVAKFLQNNHDIMGGELIGTRDTAGTM